MSQKKKAVREAFRNAVFTRAKFHCEKCGTIPSKVDDLDSHHIIPREQMPFGGYVETNGICLCTDRFRMDDCHNKAENFLNHQKFSAGYSPGELFCLIKSSYKIAYFDSLKLGGEQKLQQFICFVEQKENEICKLYNIQPCSLTWNMACEELRMSDVLIINYGCFRI